MTDRWHRMELSKETHSRDDNVLKVMENEHNLLDFFFSILVSQS